jgi:hypothetical protein
MEIWLDIYDASGNLLGPGPVAAVRQLKLRSRLSAAGDWSATLSGLDTRAMELIQPRRMALAWTWHQDGGRRFLGGGPIHDIRARVDEGAPGLEVSGGDLLYELADASIGYGETADAETTIRAAMPGGWTIVETDTLPVWGTRYNYESVLAAWAHGAAAAGFHFRLAPSGATLRRLQLLRTLTASGVLATANAGAPEIERNANACLIRQITESRSSIEIANRLYAFGAGQWDAQLTLLYATVWPDGSATSGGYTDDNGDTWTINLAESRIDCTSSQSAYGVAPRRMDIKSIAPLSNSTSDLQAAANALLRSALVAAINVTAPQYQYKLDVAGLRTPLLPGDTVRVEAVRYVDGERPIDIRRVLNVLEVETTYSEDGVRIDGLTVATATTAQAGDASILAQVIQAQAAIANLPQPGASLDTIAYTEPLDDDATADCPFWLGPEVTTISQVLLRYRVDPLRSTAKAIGGSASGTVDLPDHTHGVTTSNHTHSVTTSNHTHSVTISSHTHGVPDHDHSITIAGGSAPTYPIGFGAAGTSGGLVHNASGSDFAYPTDSDSGGTTSNSGGSSTPTSSSGGGESVTSASGGGESVTSASGGAAVGVDVDISSALALEYGIFEESGANTYAYSDIEWLVNGTLVTDTPTSLGSGWYQLDVTGLLVDAGGLRPAAASNVATVRVKTASKVDKTCQVKAQIQLRTRIQAISLA